jgi:sugar/nucleoside kinase (ribokinase family)
MKRVLTFGGATKDIFIYCAPTLSMKAHRQNDRCFMLIEEGAKIEVERLSYASGGGATNSAASFKKLGFETTSFFQVGDDEAGSFVIKEVQALGIDTSFAAISKTHPTATSFIFPAITNNRAIFAYRGANAALEEKLVPFTLLSQCDILYITSLSGTSSYLLPSLTNKAQQHNLLVVTNPGTSQLTSNTKDLFKALPFINVFILNYREAQTFFTTINPKKRIKVALLPFLRDYFTYILDQGPSIVVVTKGDEGVYVATKETIYFHQSLPVAVTNTVGAGDAFGSSFTACLVRNNNIGEAILWGIINSASVIGHENAKTGLLSLNQLEERAKILGTHLIQSHTLFV